METKTKVAAFDIEDCGIDHAQYFQGAGLAFTDFTDCAVGIGDNVREAYEDAVESLAQTWDDISALPEVWPADEDIIESPSVSEEYPSEEGEDSELYYYVVVRVR